MSYEVDFQEVSTIGLESSTSTTIVRWPYIFYESGLAINVLYALDETGKRAVGFKLSDGMDVPDELAPKFKFARQKSKLAGTIRGSYFNIKNEYRPPVRAS